ncbi:MAG: IPExxxVDY family protein [Bacteroidales bacterium]|jgi:hypothetical protein|nr:IPExxxVDY family protein [Bacteroidales bacterium]
MFAKKKLHKLNIDYKHEFMLIGIASHENDYRLSWALNNELNFNFTKVNDFILNHPKHKVEIPYSTYYSDEYLDLDCYLISNKSEMGFLLPKMTNIDFILKIPQDIEGDIVEQLLFKLKRVEIIITAFVIDNIPDKTLKIFEF